MNLILANMASIICASGAVFLAYNKIEGWGWFLFVAFLCHTFITEFVK